MKPHVSPQHNFTWLLGALIFLLLSDAIFVQVGLWGGQVVVNMILMISIVIVVWSVDRIEGHWLNWKYGIALVTIGLMIVDSVIESNALALYQLLAVFLFFCFTFYLCWQQVMFSGMVDRNKIIGAICIYILMGLVWAFLYLIVEQIFPGSFNGLDQGQWQGRFEELLYYSMVTLTTLGYGDITPAQPLARVLALLEAISGVFYTTVLVASLIGMRLAHYSEKIIHSDEASSDESRD